MRIVMLARSMRLSTLYKKWLFGLNQWKIVEDPRQNIAAKK